uniref:DNA-directed RNA polymerase III subunit RPC6 n=1 Tax=Kalanchoe fedtschenkoi TaxID=63787 RepID=A0A7N0ZS78_KALFE
MSSATAKRKRPEPKSLTPPLTGQEKVIYELIRSRREEGIWSKDIKQETDIAEAVVNKCLKVLIVKKLVKEVPNYQNKGKKIYMAVEYQPSEALTGGFWYENGKPDEESIEPISKLCTGVLHNMGVGTVEDIANAVRNTRALNFDCPTMRILQLVKALVLKGQLLEMRSTGYGEFSSIPVGAVCYKCVTKTALPKAGAFASIPCGVCPHLSICTPDGLVSPSNCVYYGKWLDF